MASPRVYLRHEPRPAPATDIAADDDETNSTEQEKKAKAKLTIPNLEFQDFEDESAYRLEHMKVMMPRSIFASKFIAQGGIGWAIYFTLNFILGFTETAYMNIWAAGFFFVGGSMYVIMQHLNKEMMETASDQDKFRKFERKFERVVSVIMIFNWYYFYVCTDLMLLSGDCGGTMMDKSSLLSCGIVSIRKLRIQYYITVFACGMFATTSPVSWKQTVYIMIFILIVDSIEQAYWDFQDLPGEDSRASLGVRQFFVVNLHFVCNLLILQVFGYVSFYMEKLDRTLFKERHRLKTDNKNKAREIISMQKDIAKLKSFKNSEIALAIKDANTKNIVMLLSKAWRSRVDRQTLSTDNGEAQQFSEHWFAVITSMEEQNVCSEAVAEFLDNTLEGEQRNIWIVAEDRDASRRKALDVALPAIQGILQQRMFFLGRYKFQAGLPIHRSATCVVRKAEDFKLVHEQQATSPKVVVLKFMQDRHAFCSEIHLREHSTSTLDDCVIGLCGWHTPVDVEPVPGPKEEPERMDSVATNTTLSEFPPFLLVLEPGDQSMHQELASQRIAGCNIEEVQQFAFHLANNLSALHRKGIVHFDLKPRNILMLEASMKLCDLDAAGPIGVERSIDEKVGSDSYFAPEVARWRASKGKRPLVNKETMDVWSFGVVLFELCSGRTLFPQDIADDTMVEEKDRVRLRNWLCISDDKLDNIFSKLARQTPFVLSLVEHAKQLIRWCLQGDPLKRPSVDEILEHPFITKYGTRHDYFFQQRRRTSVTFAITHSPRMDCDSATTAASRSNIPDELCSMAFHMFISHAQAEAAGIAGSLSHKLLSLGLHCWRDMEQIDLTEEGMRLGVLRSDVFLLLLTNSTLSRPFCLKEMGWALEYNKPILIVVEQDERFWPWDMDRWMGDKCCRSSDGQWEVGWLSSVYENCPEPIKTEITRQYSSNSMIPYRRRYFEEAAMIHQIIARAHGFSSVSWGSNLPYRKDQSARQTRADEQQKLGLTPVHLHILCDSTCGQVCTIYKSLQASFVRLSDRNIQFVTEDAGNVTGDGVINANKLVLVILSGALLENAACVSDIAAAIRSHDHRQIVYVYLSISTEEGGWNWDSVYSYDTTRGNPDKATVVKSIQSHEALVYRDSKNLLYEHDAMVLEILARKSCFTIV